MSHESGPVPLGDRIAALMRLAGYAPGDPVVVGVQRGGAPPVFSSGGRAATGEPITAGTIVYIASLAKQITAACAALLVRQCRLDTGSFLAQWMPELPAWAATVRVRHLIHHTSGMPEGVDFDELRRAQLDHTTAGILRALTRLDHLDSEPGTEFRYCGAGYICLAVVVERAAGRPLPEFAREHIFEPLGMVDSRYWSGPAPHPPGAAPTAAHPPAPLSLGDGGVWSTARDLLRWNAALEHDELGISALLHTPGQLDDGTRLDYAWAIGVRTRRSFCIYRHGGGWAGLSAQLVRVAGQGSGLVILALDDNQDRTARLVDALLEELTG
ncbi:MAG TPA: serine hydrolase domain-containing protein [Actinoplanes sp.]